MNAPSAPPLASRPWFVPGVLGLLCLFHIVLGLTLLPAWMFGKYPDSARMLAQGTLSPEQGADFSPLYLLLNVLVSPGPLRVLQSLAGAAGLWAVYVLGARLVSRAAGLVAAALLAVTVPVLLYEATLEPDLLVMVFNLAALALLSAASPGFRTRSVVGAGLLLGLSGATRPTGLFILGLAALWMVREAWGQPARRGRWLAPGLLLAVGFSASALPTLAVRAKVGSQVGATMSAGAVLHMGNRPEGTGLGAQPPTLLKQYEAQLRSVDRPDYAHHLYREFARADVGHALAPADAELFWVKKTWAFATWEPGTFLGLMGRKLAFFLFGPDGHDLVEVRRAEARLSEWPLVSAQALGLMGLAGLLVALIRRERVGWGVLYLFASSVLALGFYVVSRYRVAALPAWALFAGVGVAAVFQARQRPRALTLYAGLTAAVFTLPVLFPFVRDVQRQFERGETNAADASTLASALAAGRYDEATRAFERLQAAQPFTAMLRPLRGVPFESPEVAARSAALSLQRFGADTPMDLFFMAELARRAGHCEQALPAAEAAAEAGFRGVLYDTSLDPLLVSARCRLAAGERERALADAAESLKRRGGTLDALAFAVAGAEALGDPRRESWEAELFAMHDSLDARHARASERLAWGNAAGALSDAEGVLALFPELSPTEYLRARALAALGRNAEALRSYTVALQRTPNAAFPTAPMEDAVAARLTEAPEDWRVVAIAAEHHLRAGRLELARELYARASALSPKDAGLARIVGELTAATPSGITVPPPTRVQATP
ncbi:glycosyltransferase family 39 protein [Corallococcus sp. EGB]|uniref:glycosyltransferase family 39 protein n=1 Tax=Corallococcus sp. EGB TaxID=1521117 RepID=UPI001CBD8064|nr:glycosyltransferase family 39 protein [Corallococcus sp. EGB]